MSTTLAYTLASTVPAYLAYKLYSKPTTPASPNASLPLPPGPKPLPVIGNALNLTANELWLRAAEWADEYGDVTYLNVMGLGIMFVNTIEAANELMERRGAVYADRMKTNMVDLCGCGDMVAFTGHGPQMRRQRRLMQRALGPSNIKAYHPLMAAESVSFLRRLSTDQTNWRNHISRYGGSLTLRVTYGYAPKPTGTDPFLDLASQCVDALSMEIASTAKVWPVDLISSLKHLPDWAPGAGFKRQAKEWKGLMERFVNEPFAWARSEIATGRAVPSFVSTILAGAADDKLTPEDEYDLKWTANSMYAAALDTSSATVTTLVLFLLQYPEIAARARAELDSVVGPSRLPNFTDRPNLPYIDALMNETLRCNCAVPLGLPHRVTQEDVYNGARIPVGTLVFGNAWKMAHNPTHYPNPDVFDPTRFLGPTPAPDPRAYVFGFGRRKCPGQHIIESSLWLLLASLLHSFDILPEMDDEGQEVQRDVVWGSNPVFRAPSEFPVVFKVREGRAHLLDEEAA